MKTSELTGVALDWAVAKCEGAVHLRYDEVACWWFTLNNKDRVLAGGWSQAQCWQPSTNWAQGGPIIERERINVGSVADALPSHSWRAGEQDPDFPKEIWWVVHGPTPLISAMRCYVASRLGEEVDIPTALTQGETK